MLDLAVETHVDGVPKANGSQGTTLLVGFDSAWSAQNSGAIVGALCSADDRLLGLGQPQAADFSEAKSTILNWGEEHAPTRILILVDQPTIVPNATGQRPVERLVSSSVGRRHGGMQPANTGKADMFGPKAPIWPFLRSFGGPGNPLAPMTDRQVLETYPVLSMIAMGWLLPDERPTGRLPKYNPDLKTFSNADWKYVCKQTSKALRERGVTGLAEWTDGITQARATKAAQDGLDACVCLLVAAHLAAGDKGLMVGDRQTGYIVVPYGQALCDELKARCTKIAFEQATWVREFRLLDKA